MIEQNPAILDSLKTSNPEFMTLYKRHQELNKQVDKVGAGQIAMSDEAVEEMKLERLRVKDQMAALMAAHSSQAT